MHITEFGDDAIAPYIKEQQRQGRDITPAPARAELDLVMAKVHAGDLRRKVAIEALRGQGFHWRTDTHSLLRLMGPQAPGSAYDLAALIEGLVNDPNVDVLVCGPEGENPGSLDFVFNGEEEATE